MFVLILRGRRTDFKAHAILVLRLCMANLLQGATLISLALCNSVRK